MSFSLLKSRRLWAVGGILFVLGVATYGVAIPFSLGEPRPETILVTALIVLAAAYVIGSIHQWAWGGKPDFDLIPVVTAAFAATTILYAYIATEHANREAAETRIADQGYALLGYEMQYDGLRCIYDWYDAADTDECLAGTFESRASWSLAMLYIEEAVWLFDASRRYRNRYRAEYSDDTAYWRADAASDPTGLFSYYIVSEAHERALSGQSGGRTPSETAACLIAQFEMPSIGHSLCSKYHSVRNAAPSRFLTDSPVYWCEPQMIIEPSQSDCDI